MHTEKEKRKEKKSRKINELSNILTKHLSVHNYNLRQKIERRVRHQSESEPPPHSQCVAQNTNTNKTTGVSLENSMQLTKRCEHSETFNFLRVQLLHSIVSLLHGPSHPSQTEWVTARCTPRAGPVFDTKTSVALLTTHISAETSTDFTLKRM